MHEVFPLHDTDLPWYAQQQPQIGNHAPTISLTRHGRTTLHPAATSNPQPCAKNFPYTTRPHYAAPTSNLKPATIRHNFPYTTRPHFAAPTSNLKPATMRQKFPSHDMAVRALCCFLRSRRVNRWAGLRHQRPREPQQKDRRGRDTTPPLVPV